MGTITHPIGDEIARQPEHWRRSAELGTRLRERLPAAGTSVAIIGCGSSWFVAQTISALREEHGHGRTDAFCAPEMPRGRSYDAVIAISRSGTTTEVLEVLAERSPTARTMAVTISAGSPITEAVDDAIVLDFVTEESVVQTGSATSVVALWHGALGEVPETLESVGTRGIEAPIPAAINDARQHVVLGTGAAVGLAHEGALKLREAAGAWSESYPASEYRHGPRSATAGDTIVWPTGSIDSGVLQAAEEAGALVVPSSGHPLADLVRLQRVAVLLATASGRNPSRPPWLERSVVLR